MTLAAAELAKMLADPQGARKTPQGRRGGGGRKKYRPRRKEALSKLQEGFVSTPEDATSNVVCQDVSNTFGVVALDNKFPAQSDKHSTQIFRAHCSSGHELEQSRTDLRAVCGSCMVETSPSSEMWRCQACDFDICLDCRRFYVDGVNYAAIAVEGQDSSEFHQVGPYTEEHHLVAQDQFEMHLAEKLEDSDAGNTSNMWSIGEEGWSWVCSEGESTAAWGWSEGESTNGDEFIPGDETLVGPDGELYDIFYPGDYLDDSTADEFTPMTPGRDSQSSDESSPCCTNSEHRQIAVTTWDQSDLTVDLEVVEAPSPRSSLPRRQTAAEAGIVDILSFMKTVAVERHPARAKLFELVQNAAAEALGSHFERCALVGSTALRIDTPDSDLDAVAFTRSILNDDGCEVFAPVPADALRQISHILASWDKSLQLQLVDCTRVPVLTVLSADGVLSLDLTIDQPMSEWHVLWLQSMRSQSTSTSATMYQVPDPAVEECGQGLEAATLRCVKWWLRRRHIPVAKEGGYPTVVWTLMVVHMLRCSIFVNEDGSCSSGNDTTSVNSRTLLGAIASFFDRFVGEGLAGQLFFAGGTQAVFRPQPSVDDDARGLPLLPSASFSVLDPTTTSEGSAAWGIEPIELAPQISPATQLLHAYELSRAQQLSSLALVTTGSEDASDRGGAALHELFEEASLSVYTIPVAAPPEPVGVLFLCDGSLIFGILERINLKPGWAAAFLHRRDVHSKLAIRFCDVDNSARTVVPHSDPCSLLWAPPSDIVCMASINRIRAGSSSRKCKTPATFEMDAESWERWCKMHILLGSDPTIKYHRYNSKASKGTGQCQRTRKHARIVRI